jgi:hypothetical protein
VTSTRWDVLPTIFSVGSASYAALGLLGGGASCTTVGKGVGGSTSCATAWLKIRDGSSFCTASLLLRCVRRSSGLRTPRQPQKDQAGTRAAAS